MKKYLMRRILGAMLAGVLVFESGFSASATENTVNDKTSIEQESEEQASSNDDTKVETQENDNDEATETIEAEKVEQSSNVSEQDKEQLLNEEDEEIKLTLNNGETLSITKGETSSIMVESEPKEFLDGKTIVWTSEKQNIVTVQPDKENNTIAKINAIKVGETKITASVGEKSVSCNVVVKSPKITGMALLDVKEKNINRVILVNQKDNKHYSESFDLKLYPEDAEVSKDSDVKFEIEDEELVTASFSAETSKVTFASTGEIGQTTVKIVIDGKKYEVEVEIREDLDDQDTEVTIVPADKIEISSSVKVLTDNTSDSRLVLGAVNLVTSGEGEQTTTLTAKVYPAGADQTVVWKSANTLVASVDKYTGVVRGMSEGRTTITAYATNGKTDKDGKPVENGVYASINIAVKAGNVAKEIAGDKYITLYCNDADDKDGKKDYLSTLGASFKGAEDVSEGKEYSNYKFLSSNEAVATVDEKGIVKAVAPGKATITIKERVSGKSVTDTIEVKRLVERIDIPTDKIALIKGKTIKLPYSLYPADASLDCIKTMSVKKNGTEKAINFEFHNDGKNQGYINIIGELNTTEDAILTINIGDKKSQSDSDSDKSDPEYNITKEVKIAVEPTSDTLIEKLSWEKSSITMYSDTPEVQAKIIVNGGSMQQKFAALGYMSSDTNIVTIDNSGNIKALKGGSATLTVYSCDGSNLSASCKVTVNQSPEEIYFRQRGVEVEEFAINKEEGKATSIKLVPAFYPANTAANAKTVEWKIAETSSEAQNCFTVKDGTVTISKEAKTGMWAKVTCKSKIQGLDVIAQAKIVLQGKKVSSVKFQNPTQEIPGIGEYDLKYDTTFIGNVSSIVSATATSSDEKIVQILSTSEKDTVKIKAVGYGTATITLCVDNMVTTTCKATVYPCARGKLVAEKESYTIQYATNDRNSSAEIKILDEKTKENVIDPTLFTYTSSDSKIAYVDADGFVYATPKKNGDVLTDEQVTITATLKDDPDKRSVQTLVNICKEAQVARIDVKYYGDKSVTTKITANDKSLGISDEGNTLKFKKERTILLSATAYYADGKETDTGVEFITSNASIATIAKTEPSEAHNAQGKKYCIYNAYVTIHEGGKFNITVRAKDQMAYARKIEFTIYKGEPVIDSDSIGTINKNGEIEQLNNGSRTANFVKSTDTFHIWPVDNTEIVSKSPSLISAEEDTAKEGKTILDNSQLTIRKVADSKNEYYLLLKEDALSNVHTGTYNIKMEVKRSKLPNDLDDALSGNLNDSWDEESSETVSVVLNSSFKIANTKPTIDATKVTLNSFIKGEKVKIPVKSKSDIEVTDIKFDDRGFYQDYYDIIRDGADYYIAIKNEKFNSWDDKLKLNGEKLKVSLKGYNTTVDLPLTITAKTTKPTIKQENVPSILLTHGRSAEVRILDAQKNQIEDYTVTSTQGNLEVQRLSNQKLQMTVPAAKVLKSQGQTLTETINVKKDEWREALVVKVSLKAYDKDNTVPTIKFGSSTLNINTNKEMQETSASTTVTSNMSNISLKMGEWNIDSTYKVKKEVHRHADLFRVTASQDEEGVNRVTVAFKDNVNVPDGTYKLVLSGLWNNSYDSKLKSPLTAKLTVVVKDRKPDMKISTKGKIDIINRNNSSITGTITLQNTNSEIDKIEMSSDMYYCCRKGKTNTFTIYARTFADLTTKKRSETITVKLKNGKKIEKSINITPSQSTPKVITPANKTIYKSISSQTVDYDFNKDLADGISISKIKTTSLPSYFKVQDQNGHLLVTLANKTLRPGKYKVVVNVYFKGAQPIANDERGKAVSKTIYVEVKE